MVLHSSAVTMMHGTINTSKRVPLAEISFYKLNKRIEERSTTLLIQNFAVGSVLTAVLRCVLFNDALKS